MPTASRTGRPGGGGLLMAGGARAAAVAGLGAVPTAGAAPHARGPPARAAATAVPAAQQLTQAGSASAHILSLRPRLADGSVLAQVRLPRVSAPVNLVEGLGQNPDEVGHDSRTGYPGEPRSM